MYDLGLVRQGEKFGKLTRGFEGRRGCTSAGIHNCVGIRFNDVREEGKELEEECQINKGVELKQLTVRWTRTRRWFSSIWSLKVRFLSGFWASSSSPSPSVFSSPRGIGGRGCGLSYV